MTAAIVPAQEGRPLRSTEEVRLSYDQQADESYIRKLENPFFEKYGRAVGEYLRDREPKNLLEVGCGDGFTLGWVEEVTGVQCVGLDLSQKRLGYASTRTRARLMQGDMFDLPFRDGQFDVVYTSHAMEPNGGREKDALRELWRVASRYLVLFEPDYDRASKLGKKRMRRLGYVTNLRRHIKDLGYPLAEHRPFVTGNPLNPTSVFCLWKGAE